MEHWNRIKIAKCQILITNFFVLLLGLSTATMAAVTRFGDHLTVIGHASLERNPYEAMHYWAFYVGISLAGLLSLGAALSTTATVREAHGLMAAGFLCFALSFCVLVQIAFWRFHNPTQVEDAVLDTYDLVYDQAMKSPSSSWWQELATIQDTFLCCGKKSPFGLLASTRAILCQGQEALREDCLQSIGKFLWTHYRIASTLTCTSLALTVYAMMLCAFLWFTIHSYCGLDRKGRYTLSPRAHGCQPQEPSLFRWTESRPVPQRPSETQAFANYSTPL
ncbi:tetraspanin-32 [Peromyscus californicus insignis]|uniref:tetraspanin-32 n=1 Tax=Peromyscus californicus insignis TaxID=564181 RepID=UPI0022A6D95E|nr:tetraspanin-32 [Peromyscus californicus insignis]